MTICSRCRSSLRADLGAIGEEAARACRRRRCRPRRCAGRRRWRRRATNTGATPSSDAIRPPTACCSSGGHPGSCAMRHCAARQRARGRRDDRVDPAPAHAVVLPARAQRVGEPPPAQLQQRRGALLIVEAAPRVELGVRRRDAVVRAPPLLGEDFANARARLRVRLRDEGRRAGPRLRQDRLALRGAVALDEVEQRLRAPFERHGFHAQLSAQARGEIRQRDLALRIGHDQHQRRERHQRRRAAAPASIFGRDRRGDEHQRRQRARLVECRRRVALRRDAHLRSGQAVSGRGDFVAEVDRGPHQARRLRIRIDTMRP